MKYDNYSYLYPPRPEAKIPADLLGMYEKKGWIAQYKKNGTCNVIFVSPEGKVIVKSRHADDHKQWTPTATTINWFASFARHGWIVFVAELLNNKVPGIRHKNYIHDIIVFEGDHLVGKTLDERYTLLRTLIPGGNEEYSHYVINDEIWVAKCLTSDFKAKWSSLKNAEDEGLVLKNPKAPLQACYKQKSNNAWSVKCRIPHKNYGF